MAQSETISDTVGLRVVGRKRAALWVRVSTGEQETANQLPVLQEWAERQGFDVVRVFDVEESAYTGKQRDALKEAELLAHQRRCDVLLVWALDRLSREGPLKTMEALDRLNRAGCAVLSYQEPWVSGPADQAELMTPIAAWVAKQESKRRSERVKAGLARARAQGKGKRGPETRKDAHLTRSKAQTARRNREALAAE
jgi:putative DNA-invertase from lambdoid prophage Rac